MIEKIKNFILTDNGMEILKLLVTISIAYITAKITARNSRKNLTTQYFKEKGTEIQEKVLRFWCGLFINNFKIVESYMEAFNDKKINDDTKILINVQKESYVYCSSKTISAIKDYQQYLYKSKNIIYEENANVINKKSKKRLFQYLQNKINFANQLILITRIISRMKYDFTGEKVDELDLIKIKIKDFNLILKILCRITLWYFNIKDLFLSLLLMFILLYIGYIMYVKFI
ncbi:MAG: hypothetical protein IJ105_00900 [Bacilli bacterium]|nr:hypothetical protein [Bacilli bacterium]